MNNILPFILVTFIGIVYLLIKNFRQMFMPVTTKEEFWQGVSAGILMLLLSLFLVFQPAVWNYATLDNGTQVSNVIPLYEIQSQGYIFLMFASVSLVYTFLLNWRYIVGVR